MTLDPFAERIHYAIPAHQWQDISLGSLHLCQKMNGDLIVPCNIPQARVL